jgi:peptidyl-prolyl cis-trans isomerase A (cyclophilin A)
MTRLGFWVLACSVCVFGLARVDWAQAAPDAAEKGGGKPVVILSTSQGDVKVELDSEKAPITVKNFLGYVDDGFFDGTIFHRVIPGFMIQGGGFDQEMAQKDTRAPIKNEADNGLRNQRGTLAMARTSDVNSATAQFFINLKDNDFLDHGSRDFGYAVFGKVVDGMAVVDKIAASPTTSRKGHSDVPAEPVVIQSARRE